MAEYDHVAYQKAYKKLIQRIKFTETLGKNTVFWEFISYNTKIGTVSYSSGFTSIGRHTLPVIEINGEENIMKPLSADEAHAELDRLGSGYHMRYMRPDPKTPEIQVEGWYIEKYKDKLLVGIEKPMIQFQQFRKPAQFTEAQRKVHYEFELTSHMAKEYGVNAAKMQKFRSQIKKAIEDFGVDENISYSIIDQLIRTGLLKL